MPSAIAQVVVRAFLADAGRRQVHGHAALRDIRSPRCGARPRMRSLASRTAPSGSPTVVVCGRPGDDVDLDVDDERVDAAERTGADAREHAIRGAGRPAADNRCERSILDRRRAASWRLRERPCMTGPMELRHLRYFVAVAEELHFGRAAIRLHMAQPPLSQRVYRQLEQEIGVTLLDRTKRRVDLTAAGRAFLKEARRTLAQAERSVRTAQRASRGETGLLSIGFVPTADLDLLPRVLRAWRARCPDVEVELSALSPAQQVEALREGRIQVGILRPPVDDAGLVVESIRSESLVVAMPERHPLARRARVRLADLHGDAMILFPRDSSPSRYDMLVDVCRYAGFAPRTLHGEYAVPTNLGLIAAGLGVTLLPASIRNLQRAGVVYRALMPPVPQLEMAVAYGRDERSPVLPTFLSVLRQVTVRTRRRSTAGTA